MINALGLFSFNPSTLGGLRILVKTSEKEKKCDRCLQKLILPTVHLTLDYSVLID